MDRKRSIGVTIFAWLFIIGGILGILGGLINSDSPGKIGNLPPLIGLVLSAASLVCGIAVLQLKYWARELVIFLCITNLALGILNYFYISPFSPTFKEKTELMFQQQEQRILERVKPEYREATLKDLQKSRETTERSLPAILIFGLMVGILWNGGVIYFFSRESVKEQFE
ncbi:MAG: hypothetical protein ACOY3D_01440 [Candidatus Omnitrophota bacterium]